MAVESTERRRRRRPLLPASTRAHLESMLGPGVFPPEERNWRGGVRLRAGLLHGTEEVEKIESSPTVGVSLSVLKSLGLLNGSMVIVKNLGTNVEKIARVVALDRPSEGALEQCFDQPSTSSSSSNNIKSILPSYIYKPSDNLMVNQEVAYLTPILAFNIGLHISCLEAFVSKGNDCIQDIFEDDNTLDAQQTTSSVHVQLLPWLELPIYASLVWISFVKIPTNGDLESLKVFSKIEAKDRQETIISALTEYFSVDRFMALGDVFSLQIDWNCNSELCISCCTHRTDNTIFFKVTKIRPPNEHIFRVNSNHTFLAIAESVASPIPPRTLYGDLNKFAPVHRDVVKRLASIIGPALCPSALSLKFRISTLLLGPAGCGKRTVVRHVASSFGLHVVEYNCNELVGSSETKTPVLLKETFETARRYAPSILVLRHFEVLAKISSDGGSSHDQVVIASELGSVIRDFTKPISGLEEQYLAHEEDASPHVFEREMISLRQVYLVATASDADDFQPAIRRCFTHELSMGSLSEEQRLELLKQSLQGISEIQNQIDGNITIKDVIGQTSGFTPRDIRALVADASATTVHKLSTEKSANVSCPTEIEENNNMVPAPNKVGDSEHVAQTLEVEALCQALERLKKTNASALGRPKVPDVKWDDVGGLEEVKKAMLDTIELPLRHKNLFVTGLRKRSGILLYGPPGTGKTLLAKAAANEFSLTFLSVKGPELINMYIGESEKNVRDIFNKGRSALPCIIFFDELDSLAPARGASGDSGGVMDRVVSQMLAEIDGLSDPTQDLFIIGATNRPDLIDPALLRPGRFDKLLYVGVDSDPSYRERILAALTRKSKLHDSVSLSYIAQKCPPNFTGADLYALCSDAWSHAAMRKVSSYLHGSSDSVGSEDDSVIVELEDFMKVLEVLTPSVSMAELKKYEMLRDQFEGKSR